MAQVKWLGASRRVISRQDAKRHGFTLEENVDLAYGQTAEVPKEFADWLVSDESQERRDWARVDSDGAQEAAVEQSYDPDAAESTANPDSPTAVREKQKTKSR